MNREGGGCAWIVLYFQYSATGRILASNSLLQPLMCNSMLQILICNSLMQPLACNSMLQPLFCNRLSPAAKACRMSQHSPRESDD